MELSTYAAVKKLKTQPKSLVNYQATATKIKKTTENPASLTIGPVLTIGLKIAKRAMTTKKQTANLA